MSSLESHSKDFGFSLRAGKLLESFEDTRTFKYGKTPVQPEVAIHRIRITLTSCNKKTLGKACSDSIRGTKEKNPKMRGAVWMPAKTLRVTERRTPCGEGSKAWDHFYKRVHKRLIDLSCPSEIVKQITSIGILPGFEAEVTIADALNHFFFDKLTIRRLKK
ncbi:small ribosomal subunit protein uS10-like [Saccopteryx leptura]|uniref:small ribosomal subunit protein uS10-like n=1 Tax=Saccopteryx leptura TaxID=249018 RepID=UPI00339BAF8D